MYLIGLTGKLGAGKDTAFSFIDDWAKNRSLVAVRRGFADKLKASAMSALGFVGTTEDLIVLANELKILGEVTTCIPNQSVLYTIDGRKFFQLYGTEAHREIFGEDFWVDALLPLTEPGGQDFYWQDSFQVDSEPRRREADIAVVTDVRFENEAQRIKDLRGTIWEIDRFSGETTDGHSSEAGLPRSLIDIVIPNKSTLEHFEVEVHNAMSLIPSRYIRR